MCGVQPRRNAARGGETEGRVSVLRVGVGEKDGTNDTWLVFCFHEYYTDQLISLVRANSTLGQI